MPIAFLTNEETEERIRLVPALCCWHPPWVFRQLGVDTEVEIREFINTLNPSHWYDAEGNHTGKDSIGLELYHYESPEELASRFASVSPEAMEELLIMYGNAHNTVPKKGMLNRNKHFLLWSKHWRELEEKRIIAIQRSVDPITGESWGKHNWVIRFPRETINHLWPRVYKDVWWE
jgi:hypothetical protein